MALKSDADYEENPDNLRHLFRRNEIVPFSIKDIVCSAGSSSGDNYMSVVKRVHIRGHNDDNDNGDITVASSKKERPQLTVIIKRQIPSKSRRQLYHCDEAFCNEINAYTHVVPILEQYISISDALALPFPKYYFSAKDDQGEIIVLEDLKESGYCMPNRLLGLDLHCCELVMKQLGKLHAASIAAKQLNGETFREKCAHIREIVYGPEAEEFYKSVVESSMQEAISSLKASNADGSLTEPIRLIEKLHSKIFDQIQHNVTNSMEGLNVMCHGDLWINNIMFAESKDDVKFFDLQAMRYTSPVFDLLHFIYTSTKRDLRDVYTKSLLQTYCAALSMNLDRQLTCNKGNISDLSKLRDTFSFPNISLEFYANVLYGLAITMWILPAVTFDPSNIPNLDVISEMNTSAKEIKCTQKLTPEYHSRLRDLVLEFYQNGFLNVD